MCAENDKIWVPVEKFNTGFPKYYRNEMPKSHEWWKNRAISIDACLVDEIVWLNSIGVRTLFCCCGHGRTVPFKDRGYISVEGEKSAKIMRDLGYTYRHEEEGWPEHIERNVFVPMGHPGNH